MNIVSLVTHIKALLSQGSSIRGSTFLSNSEAGAAALYGLLSALVLILKDLGIAVNVGGTDLHTVASGWAITISLLYSVYRVITNPKAGI